MHDDQIDITDDVARTMIHDQFPLFAHLPVVRWHSTGTVNAIFRLGDGYAARFPLRMADPSASLVALQNEARASEMFARWAPISCPVPVALGRPGPRYPLPWSIQTWVPGTVASVGDPHLGDDVANDLATVITAMRRVDTGERQFRGAGRGGFLANHDTWVATCLENSVQLLDVAPLSEMWRHFRELPRAARDVMTHGDLIPSNLLVDEGRLVGVLDCGGFGPADPALDLIVGWHLLDDGPRATFRAQLRSEDDEWGRGKAWAFEQAISAVWYYATSNPVMSAMGRCTLQRLLDDSVASG